MKILSPGSFGHRECPGKKAVAKEANRVSAICAILHTSVLKYGQLDAAGHANALELSLLRSSDVIAADAELNQRPVVADGISNSFQAYPCTRGL
jgi:hypothetical protein